MTEEHAYILGTHDDEIVRLRLQHQAWVAPAYALFAAAGLRAGQRVLDLGCGPGFTSFELAHVVGPTGRVLAHDQSARFLRWLEGERDRQGLDQVETLEAPVEHLDLPAASLDAVYARWLLCWLDDIGPVLEEVTEALKPGGCLVFQEYLHWGTLQLLPVHPAAETTVAACLESWRQAGVHIDIAERIAGHAAPLGLELERFEPVARAGRAGSLVWRWVSTFLHSYLDSVVERGLLDAAVAAECLATWDARDDDPHALCIGPTMADIVLRKPG